MDFVSFSLFFLLSLLLFRAILTRWSKFGRKAGGRQLPPGPPALPIIGHLHLLRPLLHQAFHALATCYGPLLRLHLPSLGNLLVVSSPALAKEFLMSQEPLFAARPHFVADDFLGEGAASYVFLPSGPFWKFMKKLFIAELFSTKQLERTASIRQEEIRRFLVSLLEKSKLGEPAKVEGMLTSLANNIMCRMVMSARCSREEEEVQVMEYQKMVREMVELAGKLNMMHLLMGRRGSWIC